MFFSDFGLIPVLDFRPYSGFPILYGLIFSMKINHNIVWLKTYCIPLLVGIMMHIKGFIS